MDFLSRNIITGALFGALCLVSLPAFAVLDSPNYSWRQTRDGQAYKVYDPQGPHLSGNFNPGSSFVENSAGNGVIESVTPGPLTIDGATGEILNGVGLSRGLTVGDLIDGAKALMVPDNPYGAAFLALSLVGTLALDAYDNAHSSSGSTYSNTFYCGSTLETAPSGQVWVPQGNYTCSSSPAPCGGSYGCFAGQSSGICPTQNYGGCPNGATPTSTPNGSSSVTPAQAIQWAQANPNSFATNVAPTLNGSPADQTALANDLANSNAPLSTPVPYGYNIPSQDATVQGSPTTSSSTDPSTGQTTTTTSTPSYKFTTPTPPQEVQVQKTTQIVTQTCTAAGSCSVTNNTTNTSPAQQPKLGSFTAPALSVPSASTLAPTPFALNFTLPSQSSAVCPQPLTFTVFSNSFNIPLVPLCTLSTDVRPYLEALGAVGAGVVIFR